MEKALDNPLQKTHAAALRLLARREHSTTELQRKLEAKGYERNIISSVLADLSTQGLLSDERYAECFINAKRTRGFGPIYIRQYLRVQGLTDEIISNYLDIASSNWPLLANEVYRKRFGMGPPKDLEEKAKRMRFLIQRGFTEEQAHKALKEVD